MRCPLCSAAALCLVKKLGKINCQVNNFSRLHHLYAHPTNESKLGDQPDITPASFDSRPQVRIRNVSLTCSYFLPVFAGLGVCTRTNRCAMVRTRAVAAAVSCLCCISFVSIHRLSPVLPSLGTFQRRASALG
jgi:hypothetical protein